MDVILFSSQLWANHTFLSPPFLLSPYCASMACRQAGQRPWLTISPFFAKTWEFFISGQFLSEIIAPHQAQTVSILIFFPFIRLFFLDGFVCFLDVSVFSKTEIPVIFHADNQMLMDGNPDDIRRMNNFLGNGFVGA